MLMEYYTKTVTLVTSSVLRLDRIDTPNLGPQGVIYFLYARHMVERWCLSYLAYIRDNNVASPPSMDSIWVVNKFMDMFPTN